MQEVLLSGQHIPKFEHYCNIKTAKMPDNSSHLPRADLKTEFPVKGGVPLPKESTKELSNFRYSKALENSLKSTITKQTF